MSTKIQLAKTYINIIADANDVDFLRLISTTEGIFAVTRKAGNYRCSIRLLPEVLKILRNVTCAEQVVGFGAAFYKSYIDEINRRNVTEELMRLGPQESIEGFWAHQQLGIELARVNNRYNFFYDTRTGKTRMALRIMLEKLASHEVKRCLVLCPSSIIQAWLDDAKMFPQLKIVAYFGTEKQRIQALNAPAHIVIWSTGMLTENLDILEKIGFDLCFLDESSKIKSYKAQLSKSALELSSTVKYWYNLSATPAPNGEYEYYMQMRTVDPYCINPVRGYFVSKYFNDTSRDRNYEKLVIKPEMKLPFMELIKKYSIYVDQSVMPTAGKEWHEVFYDMDEESTLLYNRMCNELCTEIGDKKIVADQAVAVRAKLSQITSGFIMDTEAKKENEISRKLGYTADLQESYRTGSRARLDCLGTIIYNLGNRKCLIWANYTEEFRMLEEFFGDRARTIRGGTSDRDREQFIRDFKSGSLSYLLCHPLSIGMGRNFVEAYNAIYFSITDSWEAFKQSSERIYGHINVQPNKCHYWVITANKTVDELIYKNVMNKRDASTGILNHLKAVAYEQDIKS